MNHLPIYLLLIYLRGFAFQKKKDDPLKVTARTFQKREQKPQDSSLWTETPADREKRLRGDHEESGRHKKSKRLEEDEPARRSQADIEREEQIRQYNVRNRSDHLKKEG